MKNKYAYTTLQEKRKNTQRKKVIKQDITKRMIDYLENRYDMRFNTVLGCTEMRRLGSSEDFRTVDERARNTIAIKARLDGIDVWDKDVKRYTDSYMVRSFNPVSDFIQSVRGKWDRINRIEALASCLPTDTREWTGWFHTWFLGMVAQWMRLSDTHGNSVAPLLISPQGYRKSTFCKLLLPPQLDWGYNDNLLIEEKKNTLLAMSQYLLINIDEFNAVSQKVQEGFLKNVLQLADVKIKRPYGKHPMLLPRMASFIATANMTDVLTDPSGCRRFIAVTLTAPIRLPRSVDYTQLYAQAVDELEAGKRYWFNDAETRAIMEHNQRYQRRNPLESFFFDSFALPATASEGEYMTATRIFTLIRQRVGTQPGLNNLCHFGRMLSNIDGLQSKHTLRGTEYLVLPRV